MSVKSDRGATALLVAASLVGMMGIAALVVDGGAGFSERRQAQSGADFSVLAAVQFSDPGNLDSMCTAGNALQRAACRGAVEAKAVVDGNLPGAGITWSDWAACTDPDHLAVKAQVDFGSGPTEIECVSFNGTTQEGRVRIPTVDVATNFAPVIGFDSIEVGAFAEAGASLPDSYRILPFGIPANAGAHDCLKSSPDPDWGVCNGSPVNGNFGYLDVPTYGNPDIPTSSSNCNTTNNVLFSNIVHGVDHGLGSHSTGTPTSANPALRDDDGPDTATRINVCPVFGSDANEVNVQGGNIPGLLESAMTFGDGTNRGPLWGGDIWWRRGNAGVNKRIDLNDVPLADFLTSFATCPGGTKPTTTAEMTSCLTNWTPGTGIIFSSSISTSSRYAFSPRLHTNFSSSGWYLIQELQPIYLNTSYWGCNPAGPGPNGGVCTGIHTPGETGPVTCPNHTTATGAEPPDGTCGDTPLPRTTPLNSVTSFQLERGMLPDAALAPIPGDGPLINLALTK